MNGDYTKVPLRRDERWTGARMQEGRVLLDHEWNLNLDAAARAVQAAAADAIGPAGVPAGSDAFRVDFSLGSLTVHAGRMWVDGLAALAPAPFTYGSQDQIEALASSGTAFVYLDVFTEHVQPAEDPLELLDPALAHVDSAARTRVGYRVRVHPTSAATCKDAFAELTLPPESTGTVSTTRTGPSAPPDPCAPPGDPQGRLQDGLFRVEVLDQGDAGTARFAWSYEDGSATVAIVDVAGTQVTLAPSPSVRFAKDDLVEVSWLARRADRANHGSLFTVVQVSPGAGGDVITLDNAVTVPKTAVGLALRRWDGQAVGAASAVSAALRGSDTGVTFQAAAGDFQAGDWWGARLREEEGDGIEHRTNAAPDGTRHAFAPLALVDFGAQTVLHDCRPTFHPLVDLDLGGGACTVSVKPGDDLQAAVDGLPQGGGEVCFAAGLYVLPKPLVVAKRTRVVFNGAGPATVLRAQGREAAVVFDSSTEVEVRQLRVEGGSPEQPPGDPHLNGALTFTGCTDVVVADCVVTCPDSSGKEQTCVTVRSASAKGQPDRIRIEDNRLEVGAWQTGVLVVDAGHASVVHNHVLMPGAPGTTRAAGAGIVVGGGRVGTVQVLDNLVEGSVQSIHIGVSAGKAAGRTAAGDVVVARNVVHALVPVAYKRDRQGIFVGNARSVHVLDTTATLTRIGKAEVPTPVEGIRVYGTLGPFLAVRQTSLQGFQVGVAVTPLEPIPKLHMWLVAETMAFGAPTGKALVAPNVVDRERNVP